MKEKKVSFLMSKEELELLDKVTIFEPFLQDVVGSARKVKGKEDQYKVRAFVADLREAVDALSYAAGCVAKYPENEKMHKLREKMEAFLILSQAIEK